MTPAERIALAYAQYQELVVLAPLAAQSPLVPGAGPINAPVLLVGEAPGSHEVEELLPFVGRSGRLLNTLLAGAGFPRRYCYTTNVLLYRPPGNRTPERFEIAASRERLLAEIEAVSPMLVVTLGAVARRAMRPEGPPVSVCHGQLEEGREIPGRLRAKGAPLFLEPSCEYKMMPTYHPAAALRDPEVHAMMRTDLSILEQFSD